MESTYTLKNSYLPVQSALVSYTRERFTPDGPLQAELLLARVTTQLDHARQAYEVLMYGNRKSKRGRNLSGKEEGVVSEACEALFRYKELVDAYYMVTRVLSEEAGVTKNTSLLAGLHERLLGFLQHLLLAWVERLSR